MSLSTLQDRAASLVAANAPGSSAVRVELEESIQIDAQGNAIVEQRELVTTIPAVVAPALGESIFVFPAAPAPDFPDGGTAAQFSFEDIAAQLEPQGANVQQPLDAASSFDQLSFGEAEHETLARELSGATSVFVNSDEQLQLVSDAIALLPAEEAPLIIVQDDIEIPSELAAVAIGFGALKAQELGEPQREPDAASLDLAVTTLEADRESLLARLENSGELAQLESYVEATTVGNAEPELIAGAVFAGVSVPEASDEAVVTEIENGEIVRVGVGEGLGDLLINEYQSESQFEAPRILVEERELPLIERALKVEIAERYQEPGLDPLEERLERLQRIANASLASYALEINDGELSAITNDAELAEAWAATDSELSTASEQGVATVSVGLGSGKQLDDSEIAERMQELARTLHLAELSGNGTMISQLQSLSREDAVLTEKGPVLEQGLAIARGTDLLVDERLEEFSSHPTVELNAEQVAELTGQSLQSQTDPNQQPTIRLTTAVTSQTQTAAQPRAVEPKSSLADNIAVIRGLAADAIEAGLQKLSNGPQSQMPATARNQAA